MRKIFILFLILFCVSIVYAPYRGDSLGDHKAKRRLNLNDFGIDNLGSTDGSLIYGVGLATSNVVTTDGIADGNLVKGNAVCVTGTTGIKIDFAIADFDSTSHNVHNCVGLAAETSNNNQSVLIRNHGILTGIKTNYSGWTTGDELYLWESGQLTNVRPSSGVVQIVGFVGRVHVSAGSIYVKGEHHKIMVAVGLEEDLNLRLGDEGGRIVFEDGQGNEIANMTPSSFTLSVPFTGTEMEVTRGATIYFAPGRLEINGSGIRGDGTILIEGINLLDTVDTANITTLNIGDSVITTTRFEIGANVNSLFRAGCTFYGLVYVQKQVNSQQLSCLSTSYFGGSATFDGPIYLVDIGDHITRPTDPDTFFNFPGDNYIRMTAGGLDGISCAEGAIDRVYIGNADWDYVHIGYGLYISTFDYSDGKWSFPGRLDVEGDVHADALYDANGQVVSAVVEEYFDAGLFSIPGLKGASPWKGEWEISSSSHPASVIIFSSSTDKEADIKWHVPSSYGGNNIKFTISYYMAVADGSGLLEWHVKISTVQNMASLVWHDNEFGMFNGSTANYDIKYATGIITTNKPVADKLYRMKIWVDASDSTITAGDVYFLGLNIKEE